MKMKIKNRYDINRRRYRSRYGHKYSKHKKSLSIIMLISITNATRKQHQKLEIHEKVNTEVELKKSFAYEKACISALLPKEKSWKSLSFARCNFFFSKT